MTFFDVIEKIIKEQNFGVAQIWNTNGTGFPMDPEKCKVIAPEGKLVSQQLVVQAWK